MTAALVVSRFSAVPSAQTATDVAVKAAFIYNFTKFTEWPALPPGGPIVACIVGDDSVATALIETVGAQTISGHTLEVLQPEESRWRVCHVLFIAEVEARRSAGGLGGLKALPVLTVSDSKGFSRSTGIIELYVENERMRFAINVDAAERSGLHLSSRLLQLARVVRDGHGP